MCCAFSLGFDSLSSAATSVGAKPNHAFFNCQHPRSVFFAARAAAGPGVSRDRGVADRSVRERLQPPCNLRSYKNAQIKVFSCNARHAAPMARSTHASVARPRVRRCEGVPGLSAHVSAPAVFRRRTSRIARKCARKFAPSASRHSPITRLEARCQRLRCVGERTRERIENCPRRSFPESAGTLIHRLDAPRHVDADVARRSPLRRRRMLRRTSKRVVACIVAGRQPWCGAHNGCTAPCHERAPVSRDSPLQAPETGRHHAGDQSGGWLKSSMRCDAGRTGHARLSRSGSDICGKECLSRVPTPSAPRWLDQHCRVGLVPSRRPGPRPPAGTGWTDPDRGMQLRAGTHSAPLHITFSWQEKAWGSVLVFFE